MKYVYFGDSKAEKSICILAPTLNKGDMSRAYVEPYGINGDEVIGISLHQSREKKKTPMAEMKQYIAEELVPEFLALGIKQIVCADSEYFKALTGEVKADQFVGYVKDCTFGDFKVVYAPSYRMLFRDPVKVGDKIRLSMHALVAHRNNLYADPGSDIIHFEEYPETDDEISQTLESLLEMDCDLTCDIEAFDLKHHKAGIGTISFAWNKHEGIAFAVDYVPIHGATEAPYGMNVRSESRRALLVDFFMRYKRKIIFHNIAFDASVLIYQLFMKDIIDTKGLLRGIDHMLKNWDDTKLIAYLATNSCAGNKLSLKDQAQSFAGNYAESEITDITKIPLPRLLRYNLVDCLSTWFTHERHHGTMVNDNQLNIYDTLFKPATVDIIQMQLTGLPLNMKKVLQVEAALQGVFDDAIRRIDSTKCVAEYQYTLKEKYIEKMHAKWKKKRITLAEVPDDEKFNPRSSLQLQGLLYEQLGLPILAYTDTKQPSCDGDTIAKLVHHTENQDIKDLLLALIDFSAVDKILGSFIPAFKNAGLGPDGWHYLFGNFNLGGTVSGRLSSSGPNLQNLPANVTMKVSSFLLELFPLLKQFMKKGKLSLGSLVKWCFEAPPGWMFVGLDFASLEDRISALTTKDPNKLKVYTDGYDGHCLRSFAYFPEGMLDIDPNSVESINSIEVKYPAYRQDSKAPTFALTYQGTYITLMTNCGFSKEKAQLVETRFKDLYKVSIQWVQDKLDMASHDGYITAAFGLRVRTPLLAQVVRGNSKTPYEAEAEGRTAGNALGQSWCLLNSRAWVATMIEVRASKYAEDIRPCAQIHDAGYALVREDLAPLMFLNEHLVREVNWQDHPDIAHPDVGLGGKLGIFWPAWDTEIELPNGATAEQIMEIIEQASA